MGGAVTAMTRRAWLLGTALAGLFVGEEALALGRVPLGGRLQLRVPWSTARIDPHALSDPMAMLFASAICDSVYALDGKGRPYPTLAAGMPKVEDGQTVVTLRPDLHSARGRRINGRDLAWSVTRARFSGAQGLLGVLRDFVRSDKQRPLIARFGVIEPVKLAILLSSPLCALLPRGFSPTRPDGTGPFLAACSASRMRLTRNLNAARGPAFLKQVVVNASSDLSASLRAFEGGKDDVGWLGRGFHRNRAGSRAFNYRSVGWVVLATGSKAGSFHMPGGAQQLANAVPVERMHLGLSARAGLAPGALWSGGAAELLYDSGQPHLGIIAKAVAAKLSQPDHPLTAVPMSRAALRKRRNARNFALALDLVRHPGGGPIAPLIALATADHRTRGRDIARHPPRIHYSRLAHRLTPTLRVGVLGGVAVRGGIAAGVQLAAAGHGRGFNLGGSYRS